MPEWIGSWKLKSKPPVCLVTGLFICEDVVLKTSKEGSQDRRAEIEVPLGIAVAAASASQGVLLPNDGTGNLEAGFSINKTQNRHIEANNKGSSIFAMQLKVISSATFNKKALRLTDKSPDAPTHRQMGEDGELPSVHSLSLEDVGAETWEDWEKENLKT